jgi:hypothetical protein
VVEALSGEATAVVDPYLGEVTHWGGQGLQPHQDAVISAAEGLVAKLAARCGRRQ